MYHGSESTSFLGSKIWTILQERLKDANSIEAFKIQIKKWKPENFLKNVGIARFMFKRISIVGKEPKISCETYVCDFKRF